MLIMPTSRNEIDRLATKLAGATKASAVLFAEIFATSPRLMTLKTMGKTERLDRLFACEAWTEAAIELVRLEVPNWSVQRLCRDDGDWLCTLTRFPDVPEWLDDSAEGRHSVLALAILSALLDVRARTAMTFPALVRQPTDTGADCADYR